MSLLGSFSRSTSTTHLHNSTAIANVMTVLCPQIGNLHIHGSQQAQKKPGRQARHHHTRSRRPSPSAALHSASSVRALSPESAELIFIQALAQASLCRKHSRGLHIDTRPQSRLAQESSYTYPRAPSSQPRSPTFSTQHGRQEAAQALAAIPREDLRALVDLYDSDLDSWSHHGSPQSSPQTRHPRAHQNAHQPRMRIPVPVQDIPIDSDSNALNPPKPQRAAPADSVQHAHQIRHILDLLKNERTSHDVLFDAYQALPHPRISYLSDHYIRAFMRHLSVVEYRSEQSMLRYLSVVDDLTAAGIPLTTAEWNSAISFAGRWVRRVDELQVETATQIWLRMEREADVQSDAVTFNVLFDVAAKAGKFALAEVVMKEMMTRGLPENRYFRTNKIYYYGVKRDGAAVRQAYKDLVDTGHLVDTVVLNCVIASLIRAGEASAAEHIFERMKNMHTELTSSNLATGGGWRKQRELGRILNKAARSLRHHPQSRLAVQQATPVTPNIHTYRLLIKYHTYESGNIDRVTELLDEMLESDIRMHGSIFYQLFMGFHHHGGVRYSSWTRSRLDKVWAVFLDFLKQTEERTASTSALLDEEDKGCYFDVGIVVAILQAYMKVAGRDVTMEVWDDILHKWEPKGDALDRINGALANMYDWRGE